jgi:hypothetical protein
MATTPIPAAERLRQLRERQKSAQLIRIEAVVPREVKDNLAAISRLTGQSYGAVLRSALELGVASYQEKTAVPGSLEVALPTNSSSLKDHEHEPK